MGPKDRRSTVLSAEGEALVVVFRKHTLLPLGDCLYALQATIPQLIPSAEFSDSTGIPDAGGDMIQDWRRRVAMSEIALRKDYDAKALRLFARQVKVPRQVRRLLALAAVYDGKSRAEAAAIGGMDRQTLRDWVHRFNGHGPEGLTNRKRVGRPRLRTAEQMQTLAELVETGPNPALDGAVRWRRIDLQRALEQRFGVRVSLTSLSRLLNKLAFSHISSRPQHPRQERRTIEAFKSLSPT